MNEELKYLSTYAKKTVAAVLFLFLLIGGAAAVLSVMAAGLNALSGPAGFSVSASTHNTSSSTGSGSGTTTTPAQNSTGNPGGNSGWVQGSSGATTTPSTPAPQQSNPATGTALAQGQTGTQTQGTQTTLETPVVEALDRGGVAIGNRVQQTFGNVLAHVLQVLFVERPVATGSNQP